MQNLRKEDLNENFFVPLCNLYFDVALKELKANEFKTYMGITAVIKGIGPNTQLYFSNKKELFQKCSNLLNVSVQTFLKHLRTFEEKGLISNKQRNVTDICYNIKDSKQVGFTQINIKNLELSLEKLDQNEFKLYMTLVRVLKGFRKTQCRYTYAQLKTWSGIKNKAAFISARRSLVKKGLIKALEDVNSSSYAFRLNESFFEKCNLKPQNTDLKPTKREAHTDLKPHIKKYNSSLKKNNKKSSELSSKKSQDAKAKRFQAANRKKIFLFLSEYYCTHYLSDSEKNELINELILNVEKHGAVSREDVKCSPDFYLTLENEEQGRVVEKIFERMTHQKEQENGKNELRSCYFQALSTYFPEEVLGLDDYTVNDISRIKLDKLIEKSPNLYYFQEDYLWGEEMLDIDESLVEIRKYKKTFNQFVADHN